MVNKDPDLTIAIVSWNTRDLLERCLSSVQQEQQNSPDLTVDVCVVDNASTDGSANMVSESFPWVRLICNTENAGFAQANNQAIQQSAGRYALLLNSDTELHAGVLATLVAFMEDHPRAGACGARLVGVDGRLERACHPMLTPGREFWRLTFFDRLWPRATYTMETWDTQTPRRVEVIKGACLLLRREALDQVGLLDGRYHMYTEEVDLCYRLAEAGWQLWYVPQAVVTHYGAASSKQAADTMYVQLYRSKVQFYRKIGGQGRARRFKILAAAAYLPRALLHPHRRAYRRLLQELPKM
ncbi:MAG: glycosyltransferase family 2 protein [Candidatus Promineifilaceae bacterium]